MITKLLNKYVLNGALEKVKGIKDAHIQGVHGYFKLHDLASHQKLRQFKKKTNIKLFLLGFSRFNFLLLFDS